MGDLTQASEFAFNVWRQIKSLCRNAAQKMSGRNTTGLNLALVEFWFIVIYLLLAIYCYRLQVPSVELHIFVSIALFCVHHATAAVHTHTLLFARIRSCVNMSVRVCVLGIFGYFTTTWEAI